MASNSDKTLKSLKAYCNRYAGRRAFIIGNGPSLKKLDLTRLKNEITFGVNSIFYHFETMGFKPTFYVVEDTLVAEDRDDEINNLTGMVKIFGTYLNYCLADRDDVIWANVIFDYSNYPGFPNFSRNAAERLWVGGTVSYLCMQLAYYMGFSEVFLVGFDHSYTIPKDAKIEGNVIISTTDDSNHFHPEYFGKGKRWHDPKLDRMELAYKRAREVFEQNGRILANATAGGKLEVFPRIDYESLFVQHGDRDAASRFPVAGQVSLDNSCSGDKVRISVVVCTHNNSDLLAKALASLSRQRLDKRLYEVIVVDNNSNDQTRQIVESYPEFRYVFEDKLGLSHARNTGIDKARGDIVAFIDDDAEAEPDWVAALLRVYDTVPDAWAAGGRVLPIWDGQRPEWLSDEFVPALSIRDYGVDTRPLDWPNEGMIGTNCSFRREVFSTFGNFDIKLGRVGPILFSFEEADLQRRLTEAGHQIYHTNAVVFHHVPPSRMNRKYFSKRALGNTVSKIFMDLRDTGRNDEIEQLVDRVRKVASKISSEADGPDEEQILDDLYATFVHECPDIAIEAKVGFVSVAADCYLEQGKYAKAEKKCLEALSFPSISMELHCKLWLQLARVCLRQGKEDEAKRILLDVLRTADLGGKEVWQMQGFFKEYYERQGEDCRIIEDLSDILASEHISQHNKAAILRCCSVFYEDQRMYAQAEELYSRMLSLDNLANTTMDKLLLGLGDVYKKWGRIEEAREVLTKALLLEEAMANEKPKHPGISPPVGKTQIRDLHISGVDISSRGFVRISVVVCTHHNPALLAKTLDSLSRQTLGQELFEIIVVDNNSKDNTVEVVARYPTVRYILEERLGLSYARNSGVEKAGGDIIAFIDDDAEASAQWLQALMRIYDNAQNVWAAGGKVLPIWDAPKPDWLTEEYYRSLSLVQWGENARALCWPERIIGTNCSFRRQVFADIGFFDTCLGRIGEALLGNEDTEIQQRIHALGRLVYYAPEAVVYHHVTESRMTEEYFRRREQGTKISRAILELRSQGNNRQAEQIAAEVRQTVGGMNAFYKKRKAPAQKHLPSDNRMSAGYAGNPSEMKWPEDKKAPPATTQGAPYGTCGEAEKIDLLYDQIRANSRRILMQYKDKYRGQRCVIIGNGPSLNNTDLSLLRNEYTFGLNKIYLLFDRIDWRPSFYVSVNPFVIQQSAHQIFNEIHGLKFLDFVAFKYLPYNEDTVHLLSLEGKNFSTDLCEGIFQIHTVTYVAMQIAYHLGFDEVFLVGVDHFFNAAQDGRPDQVVVQNNHDADHFDPGYFERGQQWNLPNLKGSEEGYKIAKAMFEKKNKKIYDATVGGHLTVFEKVDYHDVFGNTGNSSLRPCLVGG